jgi:hypothetical protein
MRLVRLINRIFFFSGLKTVFEINNECTAEEVRKLLKVYIKICIVADSSHNTLISSGDFNEVRGHRLHGRISLKKFIVLLANLVQFVNFVIAT